MQGETPGHLQVKAQVQTPRARPVAGTKAPDQDAGREGAEVRVQKENSGLDTREDSGPQAPHAALETRRGWGWGFRIQECFSPCQSVIMETATGSHLLFPRRPFSGCSPHPQPPK